MKINPKTTLKVGRRLVNPQIQWVSLVNHGAVQHPFCVTKMDKISNIIKSNGFEVTDMGVQIKKFAFSKEKFVDVDTVKTYADNGLGLSDYVITENAESNSFEIKNSLVLDDVTAQEVVMPNTGFSIFVVKDSTEVKSSDDITVQENSKTAEISADTVCVESVREALREKINAEPAIDKTENTSRSKFDMFSAYYSGNKSLSAIMKEADDGLPVGAYEMEFAFITALKNCMREKDYASAAKASSDFVAVLMYLAGASGVIGDDVEEPDDVEETSVSNSITADDSAVIESKEKYVTEEAFLELMALVKSLVPVEEKKMEVSVETVPARRSAAEETAIVNKAVSNSIDENARKKNEEDIRRKQAFVTQEMKNRLGLF